MPVDDLTTFLNLAADAGELIRIAAEVDPQFELAAICQKLFHQRGTQSPLLLFEQVRGSRIPAAAHLLASPQRVLRTLGTTTFDDAVARVWAAFTPRLTAAEGWFDALRALPAAPDLARLSPRVVRSGLCQQIVKLGKDVRLDEFPIPHCWPGESGRTITAGIVQPGRGEGEIRSCGLTAAEVVGHDALLIHWHEHDPPYRRLLQHVASARQLPVAICLGGDPLLSYVASLPLPPMLDPFLLAGLLRGENVNLVRGRTVELEVPAEAEIVIEGYIDPVEPSGAGIVANSTGYLTHNERLPLMRVTAVTHRANPVFPVMIRGAPPCEEHTFAQLTERLLLPVIKLVDPGIVDLHIPVDGYARRMAVVKLHKSSPLQARRVMQALWGLPMLSLAKMLIVVDHDVDVRDLRQVWQRVTAHVHPQRDVLILEGIGDMDDHAAPQRGLGSKLGLDATAKWRTEGHVRPWPMPATPSEETVQQLARRWIEFGL